MITARGRLGRTPLVALTLVVAALLGAGTAYAFWSTTDSGNPAVAAADALPRGSTPAPSAVGGTVTTTFATVTTTDGRPVTSYIVNRYATATTTTPAATFTCTATGSTATCSETVVPQGVWYYSDTPRFTGSLWTGQESVRSSSVTVDTVAPVLGGLTAPAYVNIATQGAVTISGTITETNDSVLTIVATTPGGTPVSRTVSVTGGATSWSTTLNLGTGSGAADGTVTYSVTAKDVAGNTSAAVTATSIRDTAAPTVTFAAQLGGPYRYNDRAGSTNPDQLSALAGAVSTFGSDDSVVVTATQTTPHPGLKYSSAAILKTGDGSIPAFNVEALGLVGGLSVSYKLEAVDAAGNVGPNSVTVTFLAVF